MILTGGILLWFPFSATKDSLRFVDALFSSTSAVSVTGLVAIDIGQDLSILGQGITLFLFQIGGLRQTKYVEESRASTRGGCTI